jgi:hypothetical protein
MAALADQQEAEANKLEREGLSNATRKSYRAENAQAKNQQSSASSR